MATLASVLEFARAQSQTDSNGLTDANGIVFANEALLDFRNQLISAGVDASQTQESYTSFTSGQGTYAYPSDMWRLKTISINYIDTNKSNYKTATQVDISNLPNNTSFQWIRANADTNAPYFDDRGNTFEIFPTPTSATVDAIYIFYFLEPSEFTATSDTIGYPDSLDYRILGWRIAANYVKAQGNQNLAADFNAEYQQKVAKIIATLSQGSQQPIQATVIQDAGWNY